MKKIAINGFLFSQRPTGVMRYAKEIIEEIDCICNDLVYECNSSVALDIIKSSILYKFM